MVVLILAMESASCFHRRRHIFCTRYLATSVYSPYSDSTVCIVFYYVESGRLVEIRLGAYCTYIDRFYMMEKSSQSSPSRRHSPEDAQPGLVCLKSSHFQCPHLIKSHCSQFLIQTKRTFLNPNTKRWIETGPARLSKSLHRTTPS